MAKRKRKKGSTKRRSPRRRRSRTITTTTRTVRLSNPKLGGLIITGLTGMVGAGLTGVVTTKLMGNMSMGLRTLGALGVAFLGTFALRKRPALADAFSGATLGTIAYGFAVNASGGVVATNKADAMAITAKIPDAKTDASKAAGQSGMGVLLPFGGRAAAANGMGVLYNNQAARSLTGMGAASPIRRTVNPRALLG